MLPIDPEKKFSFQHCISEGDLVVVYERHDTMKAVEVCEKSVFQNRFGVFKHADWIGKPFGSKVLSNKDIRTFEVLLRTYDVREGQDFSAQPEGGSSGPRPCKRKQRASESCNGNEGSGTSVVMARPSEEARGHTGYLTFARLKCVS